MAYPMADAGDPVQTVQQAAAPPKDCDDRESWSRNEVHKLLWGGMCGTVSVTKEENLVIEVDVP